jgi:hypothetical protein
MAGTFSSRVLIVSSSVWAENAGNIVRMVSQNGDANEVSTHLTCDQRA